MSQLGERWLRAAYRGDAWLAALRPLEMLYRWGVRRRAAAYASGRKPVWRAPVPVVVVGNLTLGGTGKSPLVAWLVEHLNGHGWRPGILSRGYGGQGAEYPQLVEATTPAAVCGDEPRMLADQTGVPVVVDPERPRGARRLLEAGCDILVSDDGLQHLALGRDLELVVVDGVRGFGNGRCLPAGPLREPLSRLESIDAMLVNGDPRVALPLDGRRMTLVPSGWRRLADGRRYPIDETPFAGPVHAVAGIGRPARFFDTLRGLGVEVIPHPFGDHHLFRADELHFEDGRPLAMTAKDAVKCRDLAPDDSWVLEVEALPEPGFVDWFDAWLAGAAAMPPRQPGRHEFARRADVGSPQQ
ncbi:MULTISPECIES: tetraacyldisaccharide 4'-kinase [unclassified Halomonas]|uniref:tetraacyldisaccharide 4'-kinase n=1 Tax=unclassified Halomonas TaxID=2609666 RepID=UPI002886FB48|nr:MULTISPECIES: tetraacyldisaccharide 4'-kinase [unclassified Halomonas]MDT0501207.1 tetraacyldisaccharide 4'-kinase [Halomonas sp. PAR7]MDT0511414.1 tetraacyldisaccharide 4'-kinase [Halomonas sp. LES1]MDT0590298.1 tetraacyldisaccharide 4'-kinase [Halomonas sp. PAR8]